MNKRICLALDLRNNPAAIEEYKKYHEPGNVWPEIIKSIYDSGVKDMEIYCLENRMFMIMETTEDFSMENKAKMDAANEKVQEVENEKSIHFNNGRSGRVPATCPPPSSRRRRARPAPRRHPRAVSRLAGDHRCLLRRCRHPAWAGPAPPTP